MEVKAEFQFYWSLVWLLCANFRVFASVFSANVTRSLRIDMLV